MEAAAWTALGVVLAAAVGFLGVRYTARASRRASEYSAMLQAPEHISAGYDRLNDDLWRSLIDLRDRVSALEADKNHLNQQYRAAIAYVRRLLSLLTMHAPHVHLPQPPTELREDVHITNGRHRPDRKDQP